MSGFGENAGVIDLGQGERVAFKMESHNHPSRIVPVHGAMTGVGGILRDVFAMNARPIGLANYLCFGDMDYSITPSLLEGVVKGIGGYGNSIGIPTITGKTEFHSSYNENILVNAFALGFYGSTDQVMTSALKKEGAFVVYVGAMTGRDGIHGAQMASESFKEQEEKKSTVQIGDPFFGKLLMEACLEAMKKKLVLAVQDMGAAGLTSSSFEMASKGNLGMNLYLDRIPLRDSTMTAEEILLSETQERMLLTCLPENYSSLESIFKKWNLSVCKVGEVIADRKMNLFWKDQLLASLDPLLLTEKAPVYDRPYKQWHFPNQVTSIQKTISSSKKDIALFQKILKSIHADNKEFVFTQYDQRVGASTAGDCSFPIGILQLPESQRFLGVSLGGRPPLLKADAKIGGKDAVLYPAIQLACRGLKPLAVTDCLNFGNPEKEEIMSQFVASVEGIAESCKALKTPVVSGNVSFYNEFSDQNIIPTPATGMVGLTEKNSWPKDCFQKEEEKIYLIHWHQCYWSGYLSLVENTPLCIYGDLPLTNIHQWIQSITSICQSDKVTSSRVVGRFGLAFALYRMIQKVGAEVNVDLDIFQERLYEIIMTTPSGHSSSFEEQLKHLKLEYTPIGHTLSQPTLSLNNQILKKI